MNNDDLLRMMEAHTASIPEPVDSRTLEPGRNSMLYWFPRIEMAGLPVPRTVLVRFDNRTMWPAMDGEPIPDFPLDDFVRAAKRIGLPCFLRSDQSSAKHTGPSVYKVTDTGRLLGQLVQTFEDSCLKDLDVLAFAFREWLDLDASFAAFGFEESGHPIAREFRVFADSQRVWCEHFYWPAEAIEHHNPSEPDWRERWAVLSTPLSDTDQRYLHALAVAAVNALGESPDARWSVDFARDRAGKWWLIDMATAERSWHPECPHRGR